MQDCIKSGADYLTPEGRQIYNEEVLKRSGRRYLIGKYLEDRSLLLTGEEHVARSGRFIHLGIDMFCKNLEEIHAPEDGVIAFRGCEPGPEGFGHYVITEHVSAGIKWWGMYAHLGHVRHNTGYKLEKGEVLAELGGFKDNGGWSRHLHFQLFSQEPDSIIGYVAPDDVPEQRKINPDPNLVLKLHGLWTHHV
jgi:hypothetical protein